MDLKAEIVGRAPTLQSRRLIIALLLGVPVVYFLLGSLNEAWIGLDSQALERLRWSVIAVQALCSSLYLNYHFYRWSKSVQKFHTEMSPVIARAISDAGVEISTKLLAAQSREDVIEIILSYQQNPNPTVHTDRPLGGR